MKVAICEYWYAYYLFFITLTIIFISCQMNTPSQAMMIDLIKVCVTLERDENPYCCDGRSTDSSTTKLSKFKHTKATLLHSLIESCRSSPGGVKHLSNKCIENALLRILQIIPDRKISNPLEFLNYFALLKVNSNIEGKSAQAYQDREAEANEFNTNVGPFIDAITEDRRAFLKNKTLQESVALKKAVTSLKSGKHALESAYGEYDVETSTGKQRRRNTQSKKSSHRSIGDVNDANDEEEEEEEDNSNHDVDAINQGKEMINFDNSCEGDRESDGPSSSTTNKKIIKNNKRRSERAPTVADAMMKFAQSRDDGYQFNLEMKKKDVEMKMLELQIEQTKLKTAEVNAQNR